MKMNDGDEQALWEKLERLVLQWRGLDADSAARMSLNFAMTETLLTLFPQPEALDALGAFGSGIWTNMIRKRGASGPLSQAA